MNNIFQLIYKTYKNEINLYNEFKYTYLSEVIDEWNLKSTDILSQNAQKSIGILFFQIIKNLDAMECLLRNGHDTSYMIVLRSILEGLININYIKFENSAKRAKEYLRYKFKDSVAERAEKSECMFLYNLFSMFCSPTHVNSKIRIPIDMIDDNGIIIPDINLEGIGKGYHLLNSLYLYLLDIICEFINSNFINECYSKTSIRCKFDELIPLKFIIEVNISDEIIF